MTPLVVALLYAALLFAFASWAEGRGGRAIKARLRFPAYALALAVYCTSWTYYGAVGSAVADGWSYIPIYLGPIIMLLFGHRFLIRLIDAVKADGANSISEFIGGRFGNSRGVAALVTILALMGSIPYIALQLRSLGTSFALMTGAQNSPLLLAAAALALALFAMIYGTRRYEAASRNDAVLFAVGFESLLKIFALVAAGVMATLLLAGAPADVAARGLDQLRVNFLPSNIGMDFFVITLLSMAAILCLPRQFYVTVIVAESGGDAARARWPFIAYLMITLLVVVPISAAGLALLPGGGQPDLFVLQLPLQFDFPLLAMLIFLGGISAATAMVLVESIALATMVSNDLVAPLVIRSKKLTGEGQLGQILLTARRGVIMAIMAAALAWALGIADNQRLASIGLVAFAAMAQFAPALILAVQRGNRDAFAAKAGLLTGMALWLYTLALPQIGASGWMDPLTDGLLDPHALLGIDGLSPISHGTLWSLGGNLAAFLLVTMRRVQPRALPSLLRDTHSGGGSVATLGELKQLAARFVGQEIVAEHFAGLDSAAPVDRANARKAERLIAGIVGVPSARAFLGSALSGSNLTHSEVARLLDDTGQSLRFSKGLLAATLENIDPGVSVIDRDLNIVAWNSRYLDLFAYPPGLVRVGAPVADLIRYNAERGECGPGEVEAHVDRRMLHMRRGQPHSFERVRPDGRVIKTVGGPMPSGGYVMCFTDVTAEARALAEIERARAELEQRVEERTGELRAANLALADADSEKTRFLAAASHDLLQPLHAARLFSAALRRGTEGEQLALLQKLEGSIGSAESLLRSLLDISKLDAGGVTPAVEALQLRPLLVALVDTLGPLAREKGLTIRVGPGDATVESDPGLLRSIVQNYLSNAIRYTQQGGIIVGVRQRGDHARIDVIDSGPGIPEDKRAAIFREFERLPDASDGGICLGLAIVDRTARLLGARISLGTREGRGSRFSVALPRSRRTAAVQPMADARATIAASARRILVVDDDPVNCDALRQYLESQGHQVQAAATAEAALRLAGPFDAGLIDFNLGGPVDGVALSQQLTAKGLARNVALVTAARQEDYAGRAAEIGLHIFRKPIDTAALDGWLAEMTLDVAAE